MSHLKATGPKPRTRFCWLCSRQLHGRQFSEKTVDGIKRVVHKACAKGPPAGYETWDQFYLNSQPGKL